VRLQEHGLEKRCLIGEMVIESPRRDAGFARKVLDRGRAETLLAEQPAAGRDQRRSRLRYLFGAQRGGLVRHVLLLFDRPTIPY
jgi:hypothetical protein